MKAIERVGSFHYERRLELRIPQFRIEFNHTNLKKHLKNIGISKMFIEGECDLGNLFLEVSPRGRIPMDPIEAFLITGAEHAAS